MIINHYMPKGPNVGDNIIDLATKKILYSVFPDAEIYSYRSHFHAAFYGLKINLNQQDQMAGICEGSLSFHKKPDLIVIGGAPTWATSSLVSMDTKAIVDRAIPIVFIGAGSKYYPDPNNRTVFLNKINEIKHLILLASARDRPTYNDMVKAGLKVYMTGCPVMHYIGDEIKHNDDSDYFIISFRSSKALKKIAITEKLVRQLEELLGAKHLIVFHDYREVHLAQTLRGAIRYIVEYNSENLMPFYKNAKFVLSYRLHGTLLASTCGIPFLQIGNDERCSDFAKTFDPENKHNLSHLNLKTKDILNRVSEIMQLNSPYEYKDYTRRVIEARKNLDDFKNELRGLIGNWKS